MRNAVLMAVAALTGAAWAAAAAATPMTYTITGEASGSLNGVDFSTTDYTITMLGDTSHLSGNLLDPLTSTSVDIDGVGDVTLDATTALGVTGRGVGFLEPVGGVADLTDFTLSTAVNLSAPFGPVAGAPFFQQQFNNVASSGGLLTLTHGPGSIEFSGAVTVASPGVPEPASWALLLVGFGGLGAVLRRQRAQRPTFATA